jgi:N-formylglutamate deformylase
MSLSTPSTELPPALPAWVVCHVPHTSRYVPEETYEAFLVTPEELEREIDLLTDHFVDELLIPDVPADQVVRAGVSRVVVDVERFVDDTAESMAARGMGVVYMRTVDGRPLRRPLTPVERAELITRYYTPHHERLTHLVDRALAEHDRALILDLHSFPAEPLPCDLDQRQPRPDVCIGTNAFHTPLALEQALRDNFTSAGLSVDINQPYAGALVPAKHYQQDARVASVMVEINRRLYLEEGRIAGKADFQAMGAILRSTIVASLAQWADGETGENQRGVTNL